MTRRGVTLVECLVALVVSGVLLAAAWALLLAGSRLAHAASAGAELRRGVRAAELVLRAELAALSAAAGDIAAMSDSTITIRAQRGFGVTCAPPAGTTIVLDDSLLSLLRAPDPAKDSVRFLVTGDPFTVTDDRWSNAAVSAVRRGSCGPGVGGTALDLAGATAADLAGVQAGAPVRLFEILEYRNYRDATGTWWLGVRGPSATGGWNATSPVAGPLRAFDGLSFSYSDSAGAAAASPADVVLVDITVRGVASRTVPGASPVDSVRLRVGVRAP